jgi:hypothetical protein
VGRSVFLVGDSGRIEKTSTSIPPRRAHERFIAQETALRHTDGTSDEKEFTDSPSENDIPARQSSDLSGDASIAAEASRLLEPIVQQLAQRCPQGWDRFSAVFAFTVSAEIAQLRFWPNDQDDFVPVPESIAALVRQQREVAAATPAGPWWRLLLNVTNRGEVIVDYDYGDEPFPDDQLLTPEHYRNDIDAYPRARVPVWGTAP